MQFINSILVLLSAAVISSTIAQQDQGVRGQRYLQTGTVGGGMGSNMMGNGNGNGNAMGNGNGNANGMGMNTMGMGGNSTMGMGGNSTMPMVSNGGSANEDARGNGMGMMGTGNRNGTSNRIGAGNVNGNAKGSANGNGGMGMGIVKKSSNMMGMNMMGMCGGSQIDPDDFVDSMCADTCGLVGDTIGVLVCRTVGERTFSKCIDTEEGIDTDVCGCCDEECPSACDTSCDNDGANDGVLVERTRRNGSVRFNCVSPADSITMQLSANTTCA